VHRSCGRGAETVAGAGGPRLRSAVGPALCGGRCGGILGNSFGPVTSPTPTEVPIQTVGPRAKTTAGYGATQLICDLGR